MTQGNDRKGLHVFEMPVTTNPTAIVMGRSGLAAAGLDPAAADQTGLAIITREGVFPLAVDGDDDINAKTS